MARGEKACPPKARGAVLPGKVGGGAFRSDSRVGGVRSGREWVRGAIRGMFRASFVPKTSIDSGSIGEHSGVVGGSLKRGGGTTGGSGRKSAGGSGARLRAMALRPATQRVHIHPAEPSRLEFITSVGAIGGEIESDRCSGREKWKPPIGVNHKYQRSRSGNVPVKSARMDRMPTNPRQDRIPSARIGIPFGVRFLNDARNYVADFHRTGFTCSDPWGVRGRESGGTNEEIPKLIGNFDEPVQS